MNKTPLNFPVRSKKKKAPPSFWSWQHNKKKISASVGAAILTVGFLLWGFIKIQPFIPSFFELKTYFYNAKSFMSAFVMPEHGELYIAIPQDIESLDWQKTQNQTDLEIIRLIMQGLFHMNAQNKFENDLLENLYQSKDGLAYEFVLKKNILWSDKEPLIAKNFVESWFRLIDPATRSPYRYLLSNIAGALDYLNGKTRDKETVGIVNQGENRFRVLLAKKDPAFLHKLTHPALFPVRPEKILQFEDQWWAFENMVSLGPFRLSRHRKGEDLRLIPMSFYSGPAPKIKKIIFQIESLFEDTFEGLLSDNYHMIRFHPWAQKIPKEFDPFMPQYHKVGEFWAESLLVFAPKDQTNDPFWQNKAFRQALSQSFSRAYLQEKLGSFEFSSEIIPRIFLKQNKPEEVLSSYQPQTAQNLLSQNGFPNAYGLAKIPLYCKKNFSFSKLIPLLKIQWKHVLGIDLDVHWIMPHKYAEFLEKEKPAFYCFELKPLYPHAAAFVERWIQSYYPQLAPEILSQENFEEYLKIEKKLAWEDFWLIPLFWKQDHLLINPKWKGFTNVNMNDLNLLRWND